MSTTGAYIELGFDHASLVKLRQLKKSLKLKSTVRTSSLHITLMYSTKAFDYQVEDILLKVRPKQLEIWPSHKGTNCLVLTWDAPEVVQHQHYMQKYNATYDFPDFTPHTTLSYDVHDDFDISQIDLKHDEYYVINEERIRELDLT